MKNGVVQLESTGINICGGGRAGFVYEQNMVSVRDREEKKMTGMGSDQ